MQPAGGRVVAPFPLLLSPRPRALVQGDRGPEGTCTPSKDALREFWRRARKHLGGTQGQERTQAQIAARSAGI
ncbi:unnamed protein product [Rangifer tarandus platyrhynchus]|uniref:Uncharacterized protein n=1 Tax=Rangifer tarandus platyrhynchus TaxID=3082113 RepID=A0ACB1ML79_RANTA